MTISMPIRSAVLEELRAALSVESVTLWARGKSREEVAQALENIVSSG